MLFGDSDANGRYETILEPSPLTRSSGSMWGQIDGASKRDIAQDALASILRRITAQGRTGLIAYGHRAESDCSDIEVRYILRTKRSHVIAMQPLVVEQ